MGTKEIMFKQKLEPNKKGPVLVKTCSYFTKIEVMESEYIYIYFFKHFFPLKELELLLSKQI